MEQDLGVMNYWKNMTICIVDTFLPRLLLDRYLVHRCHIYRARDKILRNWKLHDIHEYFWYEIIDDVINDRLDRTFDKWGEQTFEEVDSKICDLLKSYKHTI